MPRKRSRAQRQLDESSSDDDATLISSLAQIVETASNEKGPHGGSVMGHRVLYRDREGGHKRMFQDYLAENPTYTPEQFRRRLFLSNFRILFLCDELFCVFSKFNYILFRMSKDLFVRIMNAVEAHDDYFVKKRNAANVVGLSQLVTINKLPNDEN